MRKVNRRVLEFLAILLIAGTVYCDQRDPAGPPPAPGSLSLMISSPRGPEGAALIELDGRNVTDVSSPGGLLLTERDGDRLRVALLLARPGTLQLNVTVADTTRGIDAVLLEVADSLNVIRPSLQGYALAVSR